jgi:hypothetical protein
MPAVAGLIFAALLAAAAPAPDSPEVFIDGLYDYYARPEPGPRDLASIYAPPLLDRFRRLDGVQEQLGEGGGGDDICQCQDWQDLKVTSRTIRPLPDGRAEASVRFVNFGEEKQVAFALVRTAGGWRIYDLSSAFYPQGLAAYLDEQIEEAETRLPR